VALICMARDSTRDLRKMNRRSFVATVAVAVSGCVEGGSDTPPNGDESGADQTDAESQTDEPLNESEYGGEAEEGTQVIEEQVNVELPYGDDFPPKEVIITNGADEEMEATVRLLDGGDVIYSVTLVQDSRRGYRYPEFIGKTGELEAEVEKGEEVSKLECRTGTGFSNIAVDIDDVDGCTAPKRANINIRTVTETPDEMEIVSSEERSEYNSVDSFVESYRYCDDDPGEKEACVTEDGELDFFRGGVSGRRYSEYESIIEEFPSHESEDDDYPTGTYIEHDGDVYVFSMYPLGF